jgi:hypothetical protein
VEYETEREEMTIATMDRPEKNCFAAMAQFVQAAIKFHGAVKEGTFYSIAVTNGDDPVSHLTLDIPTNYLGQYARVALPPVSRDTVYDKSMEPDREHPQNIYNEVLNAFIETIEQFAAGRREQWELPFEDEEPAAADKIKQFRRKA